jgi:putative phosphoesterase
MLIAILSDIHDNLPKLRAAIDHIQRVDALLCGGDLCSPFVVDELAKFPRQIHVVFGNNDADLFRITQKTSAANQGRAPEDQIHLHGEFYEGELGGRKLALIHFEQIGQALARSGQYDLVVYGHTHQFSLERDPATGAVRGLNPGEIFGLLRLDSESTFASYDTQTSVIRKHWIDTGGRVTSEPVCSNQTAGDTRAS